MEQLYSLYPHLSANPDTFEAWYKLFQDEKPETFEKAVFLASKNSKGGFFPTPDSVENELRSLKNNLGSTSGFPRIISKDKYFDATLDMDKVITKKEYLTSNKRTEIKTFIHYQNTVTNYQNNIQKQYEQGFIMQEWTPASGQLMHRFVRFRSAEHTNVIRTEMINGTDYGG